MKKFLSFIFLMSFLTPTAFAEVNWEFFVGGMYLKQYGANGSFWDDENKPKKGDSYEVQAGLLLQIPVSKKHPWAIETGLVVRDKLVLSQAEGFKFNPSELGSIGTTATGRSSLLSYIDYYRAAHFDIPVKAFYRFRFNQKNSIDLGAGPYVSIVSERGLGDPVSLGLNISAAYRYRALSVGFSWQNPLFINGPRDYYKNSFNFNIGINFGKKAWNTIGTVAVVAGSVAGAVSDAYMSTYGNDSGTYTEEFYTSESRSNKSSNQKDSGNGFSLSKKQAADRDRQTYNNYVTIKIKIRSGEDTTNKESDISNKMRRLREKWANTDYSWPKSQYE